MALANIALDLLGQARLLLAGAGQADGTGRDEDSLAFLRDAPEFRSVRPAEAANGDFERRAGVGGWPDVGEPVAPPPLGPYTASPA